MKIILFSRPDIELAPAEAEAIFSSMEEHSLPFRINEEFARKAEALTGRAIDPALIYDKVPQAVSEDAIMISYGGDGTFLEAVRNLGGAPVPILGINFGHLGFLANIPREEIKNVFGQIRSREYTIKERSLLYVRGDFDHAPEYPYALNEFALQRNGLSMITLDVTVGGERLATYRGDGVLLSSPTGSTAYSLSLGGPIVAPDCSCFVISPIAPHNLTMRPVVVPDSSEVHFTLRTREPSSFVSLDNLSFTARDGAQFRVTKAKKSIFLINMQNISFYDTLRNKMMWGLDGRDGHKCK